MWKAIVSGALLSLTLGAGAFAQNCPGYTYSLTNGATADANQVMANFTTIRNCANLLAPSTNPSITGTIFFNPSGNIAADSNYLLLRGGPNGIYFQNGAATQNWANINSGGISTANLTLTGNLISVGTVYSSGGGNTAADNQNIYIRGQYGIAFQDAAATTTYAYLDTRGTSGLWVNGVQYYSDMRLKTNIQSFAGGLGLIDQLRPVRFQWRSVSDRPVGKKLGLATSEAQIGLIAQEVRAVVPEAVAMDGDGIYGIKESSLIPVLIEAVKELHAEVEALKVQLKVNSD